MAGCKFCVDSSIFGNQARFIRSSCKPTAEVRPVFVDDELHIVMYHFSSLFLPLLFFPFLSFPFLSSPFFFLLLLSSPFFFLMWRYICKTDAGSGDGGDAAMGAVRLARDEMHATVRVCHCRNCGSGYLGRYGSSWLPNVWREEWKGGGRRGEGKERERGVKYAIVRVCNWGLPCDHPKPTTIFAPPLPITPLSFPFLSLHFFFI